MAYTKQELIDWVNENIEDDEMIAFVNHEVGEESLIDDLLLDVEELTDDGVDLREYGIDPEERLAGTARF